MIKLERDRRSVVIIPAFRGAMPRQRLVKTMKAVRDQLVQGETLATVKLSFESQWSETKAQLLAESNDKCAYCETSMLAVAFGDVEHYRPKSRYWWLAYVYDNYLASCAICNQRFKSDQFEFAGAAMPPPAVTAQMSDADLEALAAIAIPDPITQGEIDAYELAHRAERPLIPNPYIDDPETFFGWRILVGTSEVEVVAKPDVPGSAAVLEACERIYGINRPDLKRRRYQHYEFYYSLALALRDLAPTAPSRPSIERLVASMSESASQYAAMIRYIEAQ